MVIDYQDISVFIEHIVENASKEGFAIATIDDLYEYLEENSYEHINIIKRS